MTDWQIKKFATLPSTQDYARDHAYINGLVVVADEQTAGRGRGGNAWVSKPGNLFCSIVIQPQIEIIQAGLYSFLAAIALNRCLAEYISEDHAIQNKWPNDILVDGKKMAGILLEAVTEADKLLALIIGMGVNLTNCPEDRVSLNDFVTDSPARDEFLPVLLAQLQEVLIEFQDQGFEPLREEWLDQAAFLHQTIHVRLPKETLSGIFEGLEPDGALRLRLANGEVKMVHSGEVFFE